MALTLSISKANDESTKVTLSLLDNEVTVRDNTYNIYRTTGGLDTKIATKIISSEPTGDGFSSYINLEYIDNECNDIEPPLMPDIIDSMEKGDNRIYYEFTSSDLGTDYEYYVEKAGELKQYSNTVKAFTKSKLKGYEYTVISTNGKRTDEKPVKDDWVFTSKTDFTHKLKYAGYNSIFIRAVDNAGNVSQSYIRDIYMESEMLAPVIRGDVPHAIKYNNRYRGPHESKKVDNLYSQLRFNINRLREKLDELEVKKNGILEKPVNYNNKIILQADAIEEIYDKMNNRWV